ncbi:hypothetical protein RHMOL_Rhmol04G0231100 [Rhododendron molle]|uniref:Uncharacterized protein n=1 Tax=Rhododendron molle TaxID=49168 RepID=A0ACC0P4N8_RHOML|nr:hypothetical protein RHMOL_Rhmol04G0231100 [Rhododendron molle]
MADEEAALVRTLNDYLNSERVTQLSPIVFPRPTTIVNTFVVKSDYNRCTPTFHGTEREDPYQHIREFEEVLQSFVSVDAHLNQTRLRLFPFTLKDKVKTWFHSLKPQSLTTWGEVQDDFHKKFFLASQTKLLMDQIQNFKQREGEAFHQYWERYKDWLSADYLDELAKKSLTWNYEDVDDRAMASQGPDGSGNFSINEHHAIKTKMEPLAKKLEKLELKGEKEVKAINRIEEVCVICETMGHTTDNCQSIPALNPFDPTILI